MPKLRGCTSHAGRVCHSGATNFSHKLSKLNILRSIAGREGTGPLRLTRRNCQSECNFHRRPVTDIQSMTEVRCYGLRDTNRQGCPESACAAGEERPVVAGLVGSEARHLEASTFARGRWSLGRDSFVDRWHHDRHGENTSYDHVARTSVRPVPSPTRRGSNPRHTRHAPDRALGLTDPIKPTSTLSALTALGIMSSGP
jgi:hypothetical protein